jgi:NADH-quinone oxidoreductase subunit F
VKAVIPGGSSAPVLSADELDVALEFEALKALQNMAGSGGVIVMDDATCLVRSLWRVSRFYAEESCGQCTLAARARRG